MSAADLPFVSVIVPVWNGEHEIETCLDALRAQTYPKDRFEIIVVDNGSTDRTADVVRAAQGVRLLKEPTPGSYAARNRGLREASGDYVAFTDADCTPRSDWLAEGVAAARAHPEAGVIGGHIELFRDDDSGSAACEKYERIFSLRQSVNVERGNCATANWLCRRDIMLSQGGFDEGLKSGGDWDLSQRIAQRHAPVYAPSMIVDHPVRATLTDLVKKRRRTIGGHWAKVRGSSFAGVLTHQVIYDLRRSATVMRERELTFGDKLQVCGIRAVMSAICIAELCRLRFGGDARRA